MLAVTTWIDVAVVGIGACQVIALAVIAALVRGQRPPKAEEGVTPDVVVRHELQATDTRASLRRSGSPSDT